MEIWKLYKANTQAKKQGTVLEKEKAIIDRQIQQLGKSPGQEAGRLAKLQEAQKNIEKAIKANQQKQAETSKQFEEKKKELVEKGKAVYGTSKELAQTGVLVHHLLTGSPHIAEDVKKLTQYEEKQVEFLAEERNKNYKQQLDQQIKSGKRPAAEGAPDGLKDAKAKLLDVKAIDRMRREEEQRKAQEKQAVKDRSR